MTRVIVIGGGIGGLSAAHELAERGFKYTSTRPARRWAAKPGRSGWPVREPTDAAIFPANTASASTRGSTRTSSTRCRESRSRPARRWPINSGPHPRQRNPDKRPGNRRTVRPRRHQTRQSHRIAQRAVPRHGLRRTGFGPLRDAESSAISHPRTNVVSANSKRFPGGPTSAATATRSGASSSSRKFHGCSWRWIRRAVTRAPTATSRCSCYSTQSRRADREFRRSHDGRTDLADVD